MGASSAYVVSNVVVNTELGSSQVTASARTGLLSVRALQSDHLDAQTFAGSGGVVSGNAATAWTFDDGQATTSILGGGANYTLYAGAVTIGTDHSSFYEVFGDSRSGGVLNGSGVTAYAQAGDDGNSGPVVNDQHPTSLGKTLGSLTQIAGGVTLAAHGATSITSRIGFIADVVSDPNNPTSNTVSGGHVFSGGGGGITVNAAMTKTYFVGSNKVDLGNNDTITVDGTPLDANYSLLIAAGAQFAANDDASISTGGAISGAGVTNELTIKLMTNDVHIGTNAKLTAADNIGIGTYVSGSASAESDVNTWGLAAVGVSSSTIVIIARQHVTIDGTNTTISGFGLVTLSAGQDPTGAYSTLLFANASSEGYVRGLIAVPDSSGSASITSDPELSVGAGTNVTSGQNTTLQATKGTVNASASGTGHGCSS